jgi:uncharacterized protein CbrC (UPF0167 family)
MSDMALGICMGLWLGALVTILIGGIMADHMVRALEKVPERVTTERLRRRPHRHRWCAWTMIDHPTEGRVYFAKCAWSEIGAAREVLRDEARWRVEHNMPPQEARHGAR